MALSSLLDAEWLLTNGTGGYASSTLSGSHSRRYHSLLCSPNPDSGERVNFLSRLDECVLVGEQRFELATRRYEAAVFPDGREYIHSAECSSELRVEFLIPVGNTRIRIFKELRFIWGEATLEISYRVLEAPEPFVLELSPFFAGRGYHELGCKRPQAVLEQIQAQNQVRFTFPRFSQAVLLEVESARYISDPDWYYQFYYELERDRGFSFLEDLYLPGRFLIELTSGAEVTVSCRVEAQAKTVPQLMGVSPNRTFPSEFRTRLSSSSSQFLTFGRDAHWRILAGYHWFTDWGRDTFISLPGICLCEGRLEVAKSIFERFLDHEKDGLIPNRFSDSGDNPEYNSVDATLWLFYALENYLKAGGEKDFVFDRCLPVLERIVERFTAGTLYDIGVREDLLYAGNESTQITWMDARADGIPVTPRWGAPVELNALWFNALKTIELFYLSQGRKRDSEQCRERAEALQERFLKVFWNSERGYLLDVYREGFEDASLRPNQLYALSLPHPIVTEEPLARSVLEFTRRELFTPFGMRTLTPHDARYCGRYQGAPTLRDRAYHQGTVWPFLLGAYFDAQFRFTPEPGIADLKRVVEAFEQHLDVAGIGQISEIFDGDSPHTPRGAIAQAWSVAEIIRIFDTYSGWTP